MLDNIKWRGGWHGLWGGQRPPRAGVVFNLAFLLADSGWRCEDIVYVAEGLFCALAF